MKIWAIEKINGEIVIIENNALVVMRNLTEDEARKICAAHNAGQVY